MAIGEATDAIRLGRADVMLAGGTEAGITEVGIGGFGAMRALSRRNDAPEKGEPPVRPGPRRLRHGRGGRDRRPRGARARQGARREDLCGDRRLRPVLRRPARHRARPDRHPSGARDQDGARRRRRVAERHRLHQRPRHLDAARRRDRDPGHQARVRRGEGLLDADLLHEGRDRPLPRRVGRDRGARLHPRRARRHRPADDQPRDARPRVRPRLHPERVAQGPVEMALSNNFGFGGHNACLVIKKFHE